MVAGEIVSHCGSSTHNFDGKWKTRKPTLLGKALLGSMPMNSLIYETSLRIWEKELHQLRNWKPVGIAKRPRQSTMLYLNSSQLGKLPLPPHHHQCAHNSLQAHGSINSCVTLADSITYMLIPMFEVRQCNACTKVVVSAGGMGSSVCFSAASRFSRKRCTSCFFCQSSAARGTRPGPGHTEHAKKEHTRGARSPATSSQR